MKGQIAAVNAAATRLEAAVRNQISTKPPLGSLEGDWNLYNLDVCPKTLQPRGQYYRLIFSHLPPEKDLPPEQYIQWNIGDAFGQITIFPLPAHVSLNHIPITLESHCGKFSEDIDAEIEFLGDDCLRLKVPRWVVYTDELKSDTESVSMVEFAGKRRERRRYPS
jgi:hypothetical protein